jgi:CxxC motif-containing protein (DUF1111 family)
MGAARDHGRKRRPLAVVPFLGSVTITKNLRTVAIVGSLSALLLGAALMVEAQQGQRTEAATEAGQAVDAATAVDPGVRANSVGAGQPIDGLTAAQMQFFQDGLQRFLEVNSVSGTMAGESGSGLGPGYNSNSCGSCHAQPATGGSSPSAAAYPNIGPNPQVQAAFDAGATNDLPFFITADGPVREARFPYMLVNGRMYGTLDGGVHDIFSIAGRADAPNCSMPQPDYQRAKELNDLIFRIPTPVFGAGLIENISDETILANGEASGALKRRLGIQGEPNRSGNDGSITRFGWKAQNKSLEIFAGEAYNVEIGVTNELFPNKRANPPASCLYNPTPEDSTNFTASGAQIPSDTVAFATFMRFLAPPAPSIEGIPGSPQLSSIQNGQKMFAQVHCDLCHTPALQTAGSEIAAGLSNQSAPLYSDLLLHHMGSVLADHVVQGAAGPDEFRTAPLWGVGQRVFFMHDGRSGPANGGLLNAIQAHEGPGSEANQVIRLFEQLTGEQKQDLLNFLRSL